MKRDRNEEKLQAILDGSNLATWQWNIQTGETEYNERWAQIIGYTLEELEPVSIETWNRMIHPEDSLRSEQALLQHFAGETPFYDLEARMRHKNGTWIWVHDRGKVIEWTEDGKPLMMFGTHADITGRKKEEQENKQRLDLLNLMVHQSLAGIFFMMLEEPVVWNDTIDKEKTMDYVFAHQRITRVNQAMLNQYRAKEEDMLGATPNQLFAHDLAQGREVWKQFFDDGHLHVDTEELRFDGTSMTILGHYVCIYDAQGRITGHFGVQIDITERKTLELERAQNAKLIEAEALLRQERELFNTTLMSIGEGILVASCTGEILLINDAAEKISGYTRSELLHQNLHEAVQMINAHTGERVDIHINSLLASGIPFLSSTDYALVTKDGSEVRLSANVGLIPGENGQEAKIVASFQDISKEYELEKQIEGFLDLNLDLLCVADLDGNFHKLNKRFHDALGYRNGELDGTSFYALVHEDDQASTREAMEGLASRKAVNGFVNRCRCKDGSYRYLEWVSQPAVGNYIYASARDITEKHRLEEELRKTAIMDELTGIFNRHYFENSIVDKIQHADRSGEPLSMLLLDLDHFKQVNDAFGHPVGDELLRHIAKTMLRSVRETDILVRFGGEEFAIVLPNTNLNGALAVAEKVRRAIEEQPLSSVGVRTASLGVAEHFKTESFRHWYRRLDGALYLAKKLGRNRVEVSDGSEPLPLNASGLSWKRKWECGNKYIDNQHKELVEIGNKLLRLYEQEEQPEGLTKVVEQLLRHTVAHFTAEEKILEKIGFPDLPSHQKEHADLLQKAQELKKAYDQGTVDATAFFSFLLDDVILGHLLENDISFFPYTMEA